MTDFAKERREQRRRKRERIVIFVTLVLVVAVTYLETLLTRHEALLPVSSNVLIFGLINVNIVLMLLLIFLITRNVVKLVYERRRGILGSKLRTKLVAAFVTLTLVPTFLLFLVSLNFLSYSIENWFSLRIGDALNSTLELAQSSYSQNQEYAKFYARQISGEITRGKLYKPDRAAYLRTLAQQRQKSHNLGLLEVNFKHARGKVVVLDPNNPKIVPEKLPTQLLEQVFLGEEVETIQSAGTGDLVTGVVPIYADDDQEDVVGLVAVSYFFPQTFVDKLAAISRTSDEYKQVALLKNPIKFSYMITLLIVTLLIIFAATWFGLFLAKGITEPIQNLAEATGRIALGDLDHRIEIERSDDEIGVLVKGFNAMTGDLKKSRQELQQANVDLDERRKYMETVLSNVSAGVISLDKNDIVTTVNRAAERMMHLQPDRILGHAYQEVLEAEHMAPVEELIAGLRESGDTFLEKQVDIPVEGRTVTILITMTLLSDDEGNYMGMVLVFEDLTQLQKAERAAAWREVARRMAHEIKNPLTPIQLCAQRLQRRYADHLNDDGAIFQECTQTIINQVDVLKNLVNAFSRYARMPVTNPTPNNLNEVVADAVLLFQDAHRDIAIQFERGEDLPLVNLDVEQIRRVMVNLLDNAVAALTTNGRIDVRTAYLPETRRVSVEVADNGCGVPPSYKVKIFEPYFSTKQTGSGLGLAIVSSIISDHLGQIGIWDNYPRGTVVKFELPVPDTELKRPEAPAAPTA